jgi:hypothetical protein
MSIDTPSIPPEGEPKKKFNWLWGCLIAVVLVMVVFCCGVTLIFMPLFSASDPLGTGLRDQIDEYLPLDYLDDPSSIPGVDDLLDEEFFSEEENSLSEGLLQAEDIPLAQFHFLDIGTSFSYPMGWEVEVEGYGVTFYEPDSYTYIYIGEDMIETGTLAEEIALEILESIQEDAQEDSFNLLSSGAYPVSIAEDAYLTLFEWVDQDGYYTWAYDLEIASGESNFFLFISGEDPDEIALYGDLLDLIASSLELIPAIEESEDA